MQKIPVNYPKQQQSSALSTAFITHLHYYTSSSDLVKLKNSFFVHNFNMHPEGSLCGEAAGSEMSYGCCWALQSSWALLLPVQVLLICCPSLLPEVTLQTTLHFSKLWTHLLGLCQTGRHIAVIQKLGEPFVSSRRLDLAWCPMGQMLILRWGWREEHECIAKNLRATGLDGCIFVVSTAPLSATHHLGEASGPETEMLGIDLWLCVSACSNPCSFLISCWGRTWVLSTSIVPAWLHWEANLGKDRAGAEEGWVKRRVLGKTVVPQHCYSQRILCDRAATG